MPAPDRDKLRAGLSGILSGAPEPVEGVAPPPPAPPAEEAEPAAQAAKAQKAEAPRRGRGGGEASSTDDGEHVRTTTGYVRADGEQIHRVSIMLTRGERRRLRDLAEDEGVTVSDLVRRALDL